LKNRRKKVANARSRRPLLHTKAGVRYHAGMVDPQDILEPEWLEWYQLEPIERFRCSAQLWEVYLAYGGSLAPEPDTQSPFFDPEEWNSLFANGGPSMRIIRRC
jgi:hypothetical protein